MEFLLHLEEECKGRNPGRKSRAGGWLCSLHCSKTSPGDNQRLPLSYSLTVSCFPSYRETSHSHPTPPPGLSLPDIRPLHFDISDFSTSSCAQVTLHFFLLPQCALSSPSLHIQIALVSGELEYCSFIWSFIHSFSRHIMSIYFMPDPKLTAIGRQRCLRWSQKRLFPLGFLGFEQQKWTWTNLSKEKRFIGRMLE